MYNRGSVRMLKYILGNFRTKVFQREITVDSVIGPHYFNCFEIAAILNYY